MDTVSPFQGVGGFETLAAIAVILVTATLALLGLWFQQRRLEAAERQSERLVIDREQATQRAVQAERALNASERDLAVALTRVEGHEKLALEHEKLRWDHASLSQRLARQEADAGARLEEIRRQSEALGRVRDAMLSDFQALAAEALRSNNDSFIKLANESLEKHQANLGVTTQRHQSELAQLIQPLGDTLKAYQERLGEVELARVSEASSLRENIVGLHHQTQRLVNALRSAPKTRGRWGEETLKNVMELSGMSPFCDFLTEESFWAEEGRLRPDVILRLPGGRFLIIDAKTPMTAYLDAVEALDETEREQHLIRHAAQLRDHMRKLAQKQYQEIVRDGQTVTPDFCVMFVPGENFFAAAIERDGNLLQDAYDRNVVIVTPTTLLALAKAIAFGWRQEKMAENAQRVAELGRELYNRLASMGSHVERLGEALEKGVKTYNAFVGSLEASVLPQARRFVELEVVPESGKLPLFEQVHLETRALRRGRDLALTNFEDEHPFNGVEGNGSSHGPT